MSCHVLSVTFSVKKGHAVGFFGEGHIAVLLNTSYKKQKKMLSYLHVFHHSIISTTCLIRTSYYSINHSSYRNHLAMALYASSSSIISTGFAFSSDNNDYRKGVKFLIDTEPDMKKLPSEFALPLLRNPLSVVHAEIPVIDLSGLDGPVQRRVSTIRDISSACADWGFFRVSNE